MYGQPTSPFFGPMRLALNMAAQAVTAGEVPVGAVIILHGQVIATGMNAMASQNDPTAHAEMQAIRMASKKLEMTRLIDCELWVSLEPCAMCAAAISLARISRLYYAAADPKGGGVAHGARVFSHATCNHRPDVYSGIGEAEAQQLLRQFFAERR